MNNKNMAHIGVMEHDCLDCGRSWDVKNYGEMHRCKCGSENIVIRPAPPYATYNLWHEPHCEEGYGASMATFSLPDWFEQ